MFAVAVSCVAAIASGIAVHSGGKYRGPGVEPALDTVDTIALMGISAAAMFVLVMWFTWWGSS